MTITIGTALLVLGLVFFLGTSIGLIRFPDFYTRMHAAGKGDTLSTILILLGAALFTLEQGHYSGMAFLVVAKILFIALFISIGSPTATHAIMDAGYKLGVKHWKKGDPE